LPKPSYRATSKARPKQEEASPFLTIPWDEATDRAFDEWRLSTEGKAPLAKVLGTLLAEGHNVKLGANADSVYCSIENRERREDDQPCMLSGWSDAWDEALYVAYYKWDQLMARDWEAPFASTSRRRRR
jgi:hypothetical protein